MYRKYCIPVLQDDYTDVVGSIPWMESVESSRERRPRLCQDDCMDAGGRECLEHILERVI